MSELGITLDQGRNTFAPRDKISGKVAWRLDAPPEKIEIRLFWFTQGKGTRDVGIVETAAVENPPASGEKLFAFTVPDGPASFSGRLVSVCWAIEAVAEPGDKSIRIDLVVSPLGREIDISRETFDEVSAAEALKRAGCLFSPVAGQKAGRPPRRDAP